MNEISELYDRHYFDENLKKEISRHQRLSVPLSLLICDIDYFKEFNDAYGGSAGSDCIRFVADTIKRSCERITDIPARYGENEFGVILPNTDSEGAVVIAQTICQKVEEKRIPHDASKIKNLVTLSIGVASIVPGRDTDPSQIISLADNALHESKNSSKDRVTLKTG